MVRSDNSPPRSAGEYSSGAFKDFNFKLAVIDELMYVRGVLAPRFDIRQFARTWKHRNINVEAEGDDVIPEARAYFAQLTLTPEQLSMIEELTFDAGAEIYGQVVPFWDGEDERFDIESLDDVALLPNLKRVEIISLVAADADLGPLRARGIAIGDDVESDEAARILRDFIADEESALEQEEQGGFYPANHHRIYPIVARAENLLGRAERVNLYFHLLRVDNLRSFRLTELLGDLNEFEVVSEAYRRAIAMFDQGFPRCVLGRFESVFMFGFDELAIRRDGARRHCAFGEGLAHMRCVCECPFNGEKDRPLSGPRGG